MVSKRKGWFLVCQVCEESWVFSVRHDRDRARLKHQEEFAYHGVDVGRHIEARRTRGENQ